LCQISLNLEFQNLAHRCRAKHKLEEDTVENKKEKLVHTKCKSKQES